MAYESLTAIRIACQRALEAREHLIQGYPEWARWRQQAKAVKAEVIARLPEYLELLARRVHEWGGQVLWARDAAEARRHILAVATRHGVTKAVKSKSMTTEEIGLNPALQAAGLKVVETDLGEFLIQLAGQSPAHLTAPAIHLDRYQISALLKKHLGLSCPPDPQLLSQVAADYLRPLYEEADLGITGVNFAAAEEGVLITIENEGNVRQTAARPGVQVALMGLEKVLPCLSDAEVFLRLLPASATGQRLTALVHFLKGIKATPRGDQAFYLVVLDNGRRGLASSPELREALYCLRCGACLNICPVFQVGGGHLYRRVYPGAIGILLAPFLAPEGDIADLCTQCGACGKICPVGIDLSDKILTVRRTSHRWRGCQRLSRLAGPVLAQPWLYRRLEAILRRWPIRSEVARWAGWAEEEIPLQSFNRQHRQAERKRWPDQGAGQGIRSVPKKEVTGGSEPGRKESIKLRSMSNGSRTMEPPLFLELLAERLKAAGGVLHEAPGPEELAAIIAGHLKGPLWLEEHPCLRTTASKLASLGVTVNFPEGHWAPLADSVVTLGLGAIPELGTVMVASGNGPASWLPLQARRHLVVVPRDRANLSFRQALSCTQEAKAPWITWLTGPTRTADIEKFLVLGAQGPTELEVIVYPDPAE